MREIVFQYPQAAWMALLAVFIIFLRIYLRNYRTGQVHAFASSRLIPKLIIERSNLTDLSKRITWPVLWILACLALMGPEGNIRYLPTGTSQSNNLSGQTGEIIFLIDTSASMSVPDGSHGLTRMEEAKEIIRDIISQLHGVNVSIYAFSSELIPIVPSTLDYLFTDMMISELRINEGDVGGTLFVPVMNELKNKISQYPTAFAHTIILLSDGEDNHLASSQKTPQKIDDIVKSLETLHVKFYTIGLGQPKPGTVPNVTTEEGKSVQSKLEPALLKKIAKESKGKYYAANQWNSWELSTELTTMIEQSTNNERTAGRVSRQVKSASQEEKIADLYFQYPLGVAILLLVFFLSNEFHRPGTRKNP